MNTTVPARMTAITMARFGGPEVLERATVDVPSVGEDDVLIRVAYCGVCRHDLLTRAGAFPRIDLPVILGHQVSGHIVAMGAAVADCSIGDRVMSMIYTGCGGCPACGDGNQALCLDERPRFLGEDVDGGYAEYVKVRADTIVPVPDEVSLKAASVVICTVGTAYHALVTRAAIQPGETVVLTGASGGVGIHALRLARLLGARTIAITSSEHRRAGLVAAGADEVVVAPERDFARQVKALTGGRGADAVIEIVGAATLSASIHAVRSGGRVVMLGNVEGLPAEIRPAHFILKEISLVGTKSCTADEVARALALIRTGELAVDVGEAIPLADAARLHERMDANAAEGRLVLEVAGEAPSLRPKSC
ncbi:alcohol dehydrogenase catalytic domain-containing protein [Salinisphaera sp. T31B1]|uniref:alcohol dehydrogenase catalytic domain-containing protein n=1 Tax=Salinisphaera sp. T31B1 TaxID=727963 RepID=UPI00333FAC95